MKPRLRATAGSLLLAGSALAQRADAAPPNPANAATPTRAPASKEECIAAFDAAQRSRTDGRLRQARSELLVCVQRECPSLIRADCAGVLREVEQAQPTLVLKATDGAGTDLLDVRVEVNGETIASALDGRALPVDPGKHVVVFRHPPDAPVTLEIVVAEAEKQRLVRATFGRPADASASAVGEVRPTPPRSVAGWVVPAALGVLGLTSLGIAGVRRIGLEDDADELRRTCGLSCTAAERDRLSSELVTTNVAFGIGIGAVALAAVAWFALAPRSTAPVARLTQGPRLVW